MVLHKHPFTSPSLVGRTKLFSVEWCEGFNATRKEAQATGRHGTVARRCQRLNGCVVFGSTEETAQTSRHQALT